ncbi:MAG TPA: hypothetical protein VJ249_04290 [Candidatus Bathyarchaeia archaeon]|nr:hypothetical protein [Candidatus Bathyarchaeia archaeon]
MTPLGLFRKKEKQPTETAKERQAATLSTERTLLDELCNGNKELYEAMSRTLLLNPETTVKEGTDFHAEKGQQYEEDQKLRNARIEYQVAGQIALYEGKLQQVQKFFKKAAEVEPDYEFKRAFEYFGKKENAERAISVAREFYKKTGKRA